MCLAAGLENGSGVKICAKYGRSKYTFLTPDTRSVFKVCEIFSDEFKGSENIPENIKESENFSLLRRIFSSARENNVKFNQPCPIPLPGKGGGFTAKGGPKEAKGRALDFLR